MECPMCKYEWCWMCGLEVKSIFHSSQGGGLICEIIGQTSFTADRTPCARFLILIGLFTIWPVLFFFFILPAAFMGVFILFQKSKLPGCLTTDIKKVSLLMSDYFRRCNCFYIVFYILFLIVYIPYLICIYGLTAGIFLLLAMALAVVWYSLLLIPSYVSFIVVAVKK